MLVEFQPDGKFYHYTLSNEQGNQTINLDGFRAFLFEYFDVELPEDLIEQLFLSFSQPRVKERRTSVLEEALSTVRAKFADNLSKLEKFKSSLDLIALDRIPEEAATEVHAHNNVLTEARIALKPLFCTLSLLEPDTPQNKLDVVFQVYDSDANGYLDKLEVDGIIEQMMNVARHQQWDTIELEPILRQMMADIDANNDGIVSLEEWRRGGLTNIPLLVLLGFDTEMNEDGTHSWRLRHFNKPTHCNACCSLLLGWGGKQGLSCSRK
ncbi:EF hand [Cooperia oncophora]